MHLATHYIVLLKFNPETFHDEYYKMAKMKPQYDNLIRLVDDQSVHYNHDEISYPGTKIRASEST